MRSGTHLSAKQGKEGRNYKYGDGKWVRRQTVKALDAFEKQRGRYWKSCIRGLK